MQDLDVRGAGVRDIGAVGQRVELHFVVVGGQEPMARSHGIHLEVGDLASHLHVSLLRFIMLVLGRAVALVDKIR